MTEPDHWKHYGETVKALLRAERRVKALEEALTPSASTKSAYIGEFSLTRVFMIIDEDGDETEHVETITVPWFTIKVIMAAIRARAALEAGEPSQKP